MKFIPNAVSVKIARQALLAKKHSPVILFGAGVVGMVGTVVSASTATLKLEETLKETQENFSKAKSLRDQGRDDYTEQDYQKDMGILYARGAVAVCKLYAPAICLGVVSVAALTGSHVILTKRNTALMGAYAVLEKGFKEYRQRVEDEFGEEKERELRYDLQTETAKNPVTGKDEEVKVAGPNSGYSIYARFFDELCKDWSNVPEYNVMFLRAAENYFNHRLTSVGHVFLNEVYDHIDVPRTKQGAVVGWVLDGDGDNYIDFGIFNSNREGARDFVNGREGAILLDFNVDGLVYDKI